MENKHITRAYNSFDLNPYKGTITKLSKESRLEDEINYYKNLHSDISIFFPRMLSYDLTSEVKKMELEYYGYETLGDIIIQDTFDFLFWEKVSDSLNNTLSIFSKISQTGDYSNHIKSMYVDKTWHYYKDLVDNFSLFKELSKKDTLTINGKYYLNFEKIWEKIKNIILDNLVNVSQINAIHGDFCFSNIMVGKNKKTDNLLIKCIDPRGRFGDEGIYGDPLYDYAKLSHSYSGGYEYIIYDKFKVDYNLPLNEFTIRFSNNNLDNVTKIFENNLKVNKSFCKLVEGLIFIGMCSRHYDSEQRQLVMYLNGVRLLNEVLGNEKLQ